MSSYEKTKERNVVPVDRPLFLVERPFGAEIIGRLATGQEWYNLGSLERHEVSSIWVEIPLSTIQEMAEQVVCITKYDLLEEYNKYLVALRPRLVGDQLRTEFKCKPLYSGIFAINYTSSNITKRYNIYRSLIAFRLMRTHGNLPIIVLHVLDNKGFTLLKIDSTS